MHVFALHLLRVGLDGFHTHLGIGGEEHKDLQVSSGSDRLAWWSKRKLMQGYKSTAWAQRSAAAEAQIIIELDGKANEQL